MLEMEMEMEMEMKMGEELNSNFGEPRRRRGGVTRRFICIPKPDTRHPTPEPAAHYPSRRVASRRAASARLRVSPFAPTRSRYLFAVMRNIEISKY
ncbi:hypothetical protein V9T40_006916 [Parthenolecanium corni]|uniref:Uncharacterized protein n=1 Tax=Parthenolecanium corni TaxID=536013 RepID=A0AAN9Y9P7_9HEMI